MVRRQLKEHTRNSCTVGKGKKIWEKAPKCQPTLSFQSKKKVNCETSSFFLPKVTFELKQEVSDAAQEVLNDPEVKVEKKGQKRDREENQTDDQIQSEETREVNFCRDLDAQSGSRVFFLR